jgi:hypothetical protein
MAKPRATTIQQKFGFVDSDLKKSDHDDIIVWLDGKLTSECIEKLVGYEVGWEQYVLEDFKLYRDTNSLPPYPRLEIIEKIWEYPISTGATNKYVVGFADIFVKYNIPKKIRLKTSNGRNLGVLNVLVDLLDLLSDGKSVKTIGNENYWLTESGLEVARTYITPLKEQGKVEHGYIQQLTDDEIDHIFKYVKSEKVKPKKVGKLYEKFLEAAELSNLVVKFSMKECWAWFEVKTTIPSLGELIRQIRLYQSYVNGTWFVVCGDNKFESQLKNQGIGFIQYIP